MDEELKELLGEDTEKIEAIKKMVGEKFVPTSVLTERVFVNIESSFFHPFRGFDRRFMSFVVKAFAVSAWSEFYHKFLFVIFATSRSFPI